MLSTQWRRLALLAAITVLAVACGGGAETEPTETAAEPTATDTAMATDEPTATPTSTGTGAATGTEAAGPGLTIGYILPETGPLAFLGPPQIEGVGLAIEDINAAGGVLGEDVTLLSGDEAGDAAQARDEATRLVNAGVNAIVGAAASGMSQEIIQILSDNQIVQCSPANTSPAFTDQENADYYFRTVPPDNAVAPIIADTVVQDGAASVAIVARADDYGQALAGLTADALTSLGATLAPSEPILYDPETTTFSAEVEAITSANPDAIVIIGFGEAAGLIGGLIENGVSPDQLYGGDGLFGPTLPEQVDPDNPNVIDGMTVIGASGGEEFNQRLSEIVGGNLIYGGQAYDCAIVIALAAQAAESTDPTAFVDTMVDVTREGEECSDYEACLALLEEGADIDYNGVSGPLDFSDVGDPTFGRYAVAEFQNGELVITGSQDVDVTEIQ